LIDGLAPLKEQVCCLLSSGAINVNQIIELSKGTFPPDYTASYHKKQCCTLINSLTCGNIRVTTKIIRVNNII
jgi:hypothetical protein